MKKSLVTLFLVGALLAPSALAFAEETIEVEGVSSTDLVGDEVTAEEAFVEALGEESVEEVPSTALSIDDVEAEKASALFTLEDFYLPEDTKEYFRGEISQLDDVDSIKATLEDARLLAIYIVGASNSISTLVNLNTERSEYFRNRVREQTDVAGLDYWLDQARTEASESEPIARIDIIPPQVIEVEDPDLPVGETRRVEGTPGEYSVLYEQTYKDGVLSNPQEISRKITKEVIDTILYIGTKEVEDEFFLTVFLEHPNGMTYSNQPVSIVINGEEVVLTTNGDGYATFSVPNGNYMVRFGDVSQEVTIKDADVVIELTVNDEYYEEKDYVITVREDNTILQHTYLDISDVDQFFVLPEGAFVISINILNFNTHILGDYEIPVEIVTADNKYHSFTISLKVIENDIENQFFIDEILNDYPEYRNGNYQYIPLVKENIVSLQIRDGAYVLAFAEYNRYTGETVLRDNPTSDIPGIDIDYIMNQMKARLPQFDNNDYIYFSSDMEDRWNLTIRNKEGHYVANIVYSYVRDEFVLYDGSPIEKPHQKVIADMKEEFPQFDKEDYTYEVDVNAIEDKIVVTIKNTAGHLIAIVDYLMTGEYVVKPAPLIPSQPSDETSGDGTAGDDASGDDESGDDPSGGDESGNDPSGDDESGDDESGDDPSGDDESGDDESGDDESGDDQSRDDLSGGDDLSGDNASEDETTGNNTPGDDTSSDLKPNVGAPNGGTTSKETSASENPNVGMSNEETINENATEDDKDTPDSGVTADKDKGTVAGKPIHNVSSGPTESSESVLPKTGERNNKSLLAVGLLSALSGLGLLFKGRS